MIESILGHGSAEGWLEHGESVSVFFVGSEFSRSRFRFIRAFL